METKVAFAVLQASLLVCALFLTFNVQSVSASSTIYIRPDGSVDPSTAPIERVGDVYVLTDDLYGAIHVERSNVVVDGVGHTVQLGLRIQYVNNVTIQKMQINGGMNDGVFVYDSSNDRIVGNNITADSGSGIWLLNSNGSDVSENNISHSVRGIRIHHGFSNSIRGNNVTDSDAGIRLDSGSNNVLRNNRMTGNGIDFAVFPSLTLSDFTNDVDSSNTVDGKPVYWWINKQDMAVPSDAGFVALVDCTRITLKNLNLANNYVGLYLISTTNSTVTQNNITDNYFDGLLLLQSSSNSISENNITYNGDAITLHSSDYNRMSRNIMFGNIICGISLYSSSYNTISENNVTGNGEGIILEQGSSYNRILENYLGRSRVSSLSIYSAASGNEIFHNNIYGQINIYFPEFNVQIWDDGYPSGGNYWSTYNSTDFYTGPYQNLSGSDGIGDTALLFGERNVDRYPLMNPWKPPIPGDINKDARVDVRDLTLVAKAFGSYEGHLNWNPIGDINHDGKIDIKDLVLIAKNFGRT